MKYINPDLKDWQIALVDDCGWIIPDECLIIKSEKFFYFKKIAYICRKLISWLLSHQ
jgi:hypothetical protein